MRITTMSDNELTSLKEEIKTVFGRFKRPKKAVVTAGMPYANGPVHIGHLPVLIFQLISMHATCV